MAFAAPTAGPGGLPSHLPSRGRQSRRGREGKELRFESRAARRGGNLAFPLQQVAKAWSPVPTLQGKGKFWRAERCSPHLQGDLPMARPSKQLLGAPRAVTLTGRDARFNYTQHVTFMCLQNYIHRHCNSLKGAFFTRVSKMKRFNYSL